MRQALFAVVLVSASFAGGAVINGPGLRWAQSLLNGRGVPPDEAGPEAVAAEPIPSRPIPPLVVPPAAAKAEPLAVRASAPGPAAEPPPAPDPAPVPPEAGPGPVALPAPTPVAEAPALEPPAPLATSHDRDREAFARARADGPAAPEAVKIAEKDATIRLASLPGEPAPAADPPAAAGDWGEVRKAMRALGVSRYGVEGEPGGRARFHCVIPLAGRRAVGQHFEAEGDDDLQAARAALKRVALWRATEAPPAAP